MIISNSLGYLFISTPRAATCSLYMWLQTQRQGKRTGTFHDIRVPDKAAKYFKWTSVRNPYSRAVSFWWWVTNHPKGRPELKGMPFLPLMDWLLNPPAELKNTLFFIRSQANRLKEIKLDAVVHQESLAKDVADLPFVECEKPAIARLNSTFAHAAMWQKPTWYGKELTRAEKQAVLHWEGGEEGFQRFGYEP